MFPLSLSDVQSSFINASKKVVSSMRFPLKSAEEWLASQDWEQLDYVGWRDPKFTQRAYLIVPGPIAPRGIVLQLSDTVTAHRKIMCELCRDIRCDTPVKLFVASKRGASGRAGNTVGTLICENFSCSRNVRRELPPSQIPLGDVDPNTRLIESLQHRSAEFADRVSEP